VDPWVHCPLSLLWIFIKVLNWKYWPRIVLGIVPAASDSLEVWDGKEPWWFSAEPCPCGLVFLSVGVGFMLRLLALFYALDYLCRYIVCCTSVSLLCHFFFPPASLITDLLQLFLGLPLFLLPWGFHSRAAFGISPSSFLNVWPIHLNFLFLISRFIFAWSVN
jgi:hypothetical protein